MSNPTSSIEPKKSLSERVSEASPKKKALVAGVTTIAIVGVSIGIIALNQPQPLRTADGELVNASEALVDAESLFTEYAANVGGLLPSKPSRPSTCFFEQAGEHVTNTLFCGAWRDSGATLGSYVSLRVSFDQAENGGVEVLVPESLEDAAITRNASVSVGSELRRPDGIHALPASVMDLIKPETIVLPADSLENVESADGSSIDGIQRLGEGYIPAPESLNPAPGAAGKRLEAGGAVVYVDGYSEAGWITEGKVDPDAGSLIPSEEDPEKRKNYSPESGKKIIVIDTSLQTPSNDDNYGIEPVPPAFITINGDRVIEIKEGNQKEILIVDEDAQIGIEVSRNQERVAIPDLSRPNAKAGGGIHQALLPGTVDIFGPNGIGLNLTTSTVFTNYASYQYEAVIPRAILDNSDEESNLGGDAELANLDEPLNKDGSPKRVRPGQEVNRLKFLVLGESWSVSNGAEKVIPGTQNSTWSIKQVSVDGEILKPEEYTFSAEQGKSTAGSDYIGSANSMLDASTTTSITLESDRFIGAEKIVIVPNVTVSGKTWSYLQAGEAFWSDLPWVQDSGWSLTRNAKDLIPVDQQIPYELAIDEAFTGSIVVEQSTGTISGGVEKAW